jgi:hypothetical protein
MVHWLPVRPRCLYISFRPSRKAREAFCPTARTIL